MSQEDSSLPATHRWLLPALAGLFFISGACGLIYQVLWLRLLGLVFGVTVYAASTVWAAFMGGLAIGSLIGGRAGDRVSRPLALFGVVEVLVGLSALATPAALSWLQQFYVGIAPSFAEAPVLTTLARLALSMTVLAVPTILMGATLPLVIQSALVRNSQLGARAGVLYATNTAGAIAGTLLAGLWFIPGLGLSGTFLVAASANVLVGLTALVLGYRATPAPARPAVAPPAVAETSADATPDRVRTTVLWVFFVSGLATLALEVIWFRVLVLIVRPTVYAFSLMLATVLLGIALGSYLAAPWLRRQRNLVTALAIVELALAATALISLATLNVSPRLYPSIEPWLLKVVPGYLAFTIAMAIPAVLPASVLMGLGFPLGLQLWAGRGSDTRAAGRIGVFYSINLAGAILGSLLAGFVLLPMLGSKGSLILTATLIFVSGIALMLVAGPLTTRRASAVLVLSAAFVAGGAAIGDPFDAFLKARYPSDRLVWREESVQATVSVHRRGPRFSLHVEGNHQASDEGNMVFIHRRIGHLGLIVHPDPKRVLVIGLGGGATPGAAAVHEGVNVDVVELSRAVVKGAEYFPHVNHDILKRPNATVRVDDGRNFLLTTTQKYDVITADIILPIYAGSTNLYSADYFKLVKNALNPGGVFVQWVAGTDAEYKTIARTFLSVFPDATVWDDGTKLIGSNAPIRLRESDFERKRQIPGRQFALEDAAVPSFQDLVRLFRAGPNELRAFVGEGPILTDNLPLVEYFLSLPRDRDVDLEPLRGDVTPYLQR